MTELYSYIQAIIGTALAVKAMRNVLHCGFWIFITEYSHINPYQLIYRYIDRNYGVFSQNSLIFRHSYQNVHLKNSF